MNEIVSAKLSAYLYANKNSIFLYKKFNWKVSNNYKLLKKKPLISLMKFIG